MQKTILISGIKGFLASHLARLLCKKYAIYGIGKKEESFNGIHVYGHNQLDTIPINPDYVIICHAAVSSGAEKLPPETLFEVNVSLTKKIISKFHHAKIVYISSVSVYDPITKLIKENSPINPVSDYAISKLWAEKSLLHIQQFVILRLSSVYGIGMKENTIIPNYINQALNNKRIEVWGKGLRKQNYISVSDACEYIHHTLKQFEKIKSKTLLVVGNKEFSNQKLAQIVAKQTGAVIHNINSDSCLSARYDNKLTCELLEFTPQINFETEISNYIKWKKEQY